jgi:Methylamine utilisation protein MauE
VILVTSDGRGHVAVLAGLVAAAYALLFAAALLGKVDGWPSWSEAVSGFVPRRARIATVVRFGVPPAEGAVAAVSLLQPKVGLLASGALLGIFAAVVVGLRSSHEGEECNCFGAVASSRISLGLAARNAVLAGIALGVALATRDVHVSRISTTEMLVVVLLGSLLLVFSEFRRFSQTQQRRARA